MTRARESKEQDQALSGAMERPSAPGKEGRSSTFGAGQPLVADLAAVESALSGAPRKEVSNARVEAKVDLPPEKAPSGSGAGGPGAGGGAREARGAAVEGGPGGARAAQEGAEAGLEAPEGERAGGEQGAAGAGGVEGAGLQGKTLDAGPLRAMEGLLGADFSGVQLVVDDVRTASAGASALVEKAGELVVSSAEVIDGKVNPALLAHEAAHLVQLDNAAGKKSAGGEAPLGGDMRPSTPAALEKEARAAASSVMSGNPFEAGGRARSGAVMRTEAGASPTAGAAPAGQALPATQALSFQGAPIVMNVTEREVSSQSAGARRVLATVSSKPDWLVLNNVYLTYNEQAELQSGEATYRINMTSTNPYLQVSGSHGSDLSRLQAEFNAQGNLVNTPSLPSMRLRARGLGEVEVTNVGVDLGGMHFDATLRSPQLTELVSRLPGVTMGSDAAVEIHRSGGVVDLDGKATVEVARAGRKLLEGELEFKSRGESYEAKVELGFGETIPVLRAVKLEGTYTPDDGVEATAELTRELGSPAGGKFELTGGISMSYSSDAGVSFDGVHVGAKLKVSEGREFSGSVGLDDEMNVKGELAGEFSPNRNLQINGEGEVTWNLSTNEVMGEGELKARIMRHTDVDIPFTYNSGGSPQWELNPSIEVSDVRIPGLDRPLEHNFQAPIPRMRVPLFGPLVVEGGMELALNASLGPARLDEARLEAELDVDRGFDFKRANLEGSLVCPFNAEAVMGFQLGLGLNLVIADGGAGIEARARLGMPADEEQRSARVDVRADLTQDASGGNTLSLDSSFNIETALELTADVNLYARYDTWFTRERVFRHNLASYNFGSWGPLGAGGSMRYDESGLSFTGVEWKTPTFEAPGAEWVRQQFGPIRDWF